MGLHGYTRLMICTILHTIYEIWHAKHNKIFNA